MRSECSALSAVHHVLAGAGLASGRGPTVPRLMGVSSDAALLVTEMYAAPTTPTLIERGESERAGRLAAQWLRAAATPGVTLGDPYDPRHAPGRDIDYALAAGGRALSGA